jgi:hypothetical protein
MVKYRKRERRKQIVIFSTNVFVTGRKGNTKK